MAESSWAQQAVDRFFEGRTYPTQIQCMQIAKSVTSALDVYNVDTPGSMSYTVICKWPDGAKKPLVVSFRAPEAHLDQSMGKLAQRIHGSLTPEISQHGLVDDAEPPLAIYTMPYLPGISCVDALVCQVEMDKATEAKHICFIQHLARYFARCWLNPQDVTRESRARVLETIRCRIDQLEGSLSSATVPSASAVSELGSSLPALFALDYPQVLTHGDLSRTNILVDEDTYEITGIVDWSLATILPFGMEIDSMFLTTGYMNRSGWHDYACCGRLREVFWGEFFSAIGVENVRQRDNIREMAERAARIGAILRYAFQRNPDGSPSRNLAPDGASTWKYLQAWITN